MEINKKIKKVFSAINKPSRFEFELSDEMKQLTKITNHWNDYPCDKTSLEKLMKSELKEGIKVLEIGAWLGRTTILFMELIQGYGSLYVVDNWHGTDFWNHEVESAKVFDYFYLYCINIKEKGFYEDVKIINMSSSQACEIVKDDFFDIIFLDADHRYQSVKSDIFNWYPKLKEGGLFIGHDCEIIFSRLDEHIQQIILNPKNEDVDFITFPSTNNINGHGGLHPGVIRAIHEIFKDNVVTNKNSSVWSIRKDSSLINDTIKI